MTASYNADVDVTVRVAFNQDVYDETPTWSDVTADVLSFSTSRGRSRILDRVQPGVATIRLLNTSGDYSPWNGSGSYTLKLMDKVNIQATYNSITYDLFTGYVVTYPNTWTNAGHYPVVQLQAVDGFHLLAMFEEEFTAPEEPSGTRVNRMLTEAGWPLAWRSVDTGNKQVQALTADFHSIAGEIQRCVVVEDGLFYISGAGDAIFQNGLTRITDDTIQATFSDDGAGVSYRDIQVDYDDSQLWNAASVTRNGGELQYSSSGSSISLYGQRDLHISDTLHVADGEAKALADWYMAEFRTQIARVPAVTLTPEVDPSVLWPEAFTLDFLDKVNVELTTAAGDDFDEDCYVEGVTHNATMVGSRSWETTFQLSPDLPFTDWWILGTSELGTDTRLAY